jgi:PBP1b-binding outer membrane lipoprotein LpoB
MKLTALLAILIGIILVGCSNGPPTGAEQSDNIDATVAAPVAATRTASDVQEKVAATLTHPPNYGTSQPDDRASVNSKEGSRPSPSAK